jgi:hypothetical protein
VYKCSDYLQGHLNGVWNDSQWNTVETDSSIISKSLLYTSASVLKQPAGPSKANESKSTEAI